MRRISKVLSGEDWIRAELLFDPKNLIVFSKTVWSAGSTALNFAGAQSDYEVSDKVILSFTTAVGYHDTPTGLLWHVAGLDGLGDRTDLVDF